MFDSIVKVGTPIMAVTGATVGVVSLVKEIRDNKKAREAVTKLSDNVNSSLSCLATRVAKIDEDMVALASAVENLKKKTEASDAAITSLKIWNDAHLAQFHGMAVVPAAPVAPATQTK